MLATGAAMTRFGTARAALFAFCLLVGSTALAQDQRAQLEAQLTASYPGCAAAKAPLPAERKQRANALAACLQTLDRYAERLQQNRSKISGQALNNLVARYKADLSRMTTDYCGLVTSC